MHEQISGTVDRIIFHNQENSFYIFTLRQKQKELIYVKGYIAQVNPGEQVTIQGAWVHHPKFGKQFDAQQYSAHTPTTVEGLKKYLSSGLIKGIGPVYAEKLVNHFGIDVLTIIDEQPHLLNNVPGIGEKRIERIVAAWHDQKNVAKIMVFLQEKSVSPTYALKIYKKYGNDSIAVVVENPYRLAEDIWGIGFKIADQIARNLDFSHDSVKRIKAGILFVITNATQNGHLYIELESLKTKTLALLELEQEHAESNLKIALHELYNNQKIILLSTQNTHFVSLASYYYSEKSVAHIIKDLLKYPTERMFDLDAIYKKLYAAESAITLNEDQQRGILASLQHKITIITGGPGTGKTTLIKQLLTILDEHSVRYRLAAPTGRAAKRMSEGTGRIAITLHRLLEFDVTTMGFTRNEQNALALDFIIIDEASMIDIFLARSLLRALPLHAHVIFIGDVDQLPAVGAGNFLNDLIASQIVQCIRLTKIFRQAQDSLIIINAHRINHGEFPTIAIPDTRRDFIFIKEENPENVHAHLQHIFSQILPRFTIKPHNTTVLVPMNRGIVGTQVINTKLQTMLNPQSSEQSITHAGTVFKIGDRVMQIRNNYDKLVFNGDIGIIENIDLDDRTMHINFDRIVEYEFAELDELVLAYAISIHKSQGSEYEAVIIIIQMSHFTLLQRNLLYTAVTRAKKLCIVIGQPKAIAIAIKNNKGLERTTFLKEFLTTDLTCR